MALTICRICGSSVFDEILDVKEMMFGTEKVYKYYKCSNCSVLQIEEPVFDQKLLYPENYYSFSRQPNRILDYLLKVKYKNIVARELGLFTLFPKVPDYRQNKESKALEFFHNKSISILDVGCGNGKLIEALFSLGYRKVEGIDPFISNDLNHDGWKVKKAFITELDDSKKYDLIMLHHSFEHMSNPREVLGKIRDLLSDEGRCIIRIPVSDSYAYENYKNNWVQLDAPRHVFLYTNKSMNFLAEQVGLKIESVKDDSSIFQFIGSEQYRNGISLFSPNAYFQPFPKRLFKKSAFSKKQLNYFISKAGELNNLGRGDQRVYLLKKSDPC